MREAGATKRRKKGGSNLFLQASFCFLTSHRTHQTISSAFLYDPGEHRVVLNHPRGKQGREEEGKERRREGRKEGRKETARQPTKRIRRDMISLAGFFQPATNGIDPICHVALVFGAQTFSKTCPACLRRPIIVDSKDIIRKRDTEGTAREYGWTEGEQARTETRGTHHWIPGDLPRRETKRAYRKWGGGRKQTKLQRPWPSNEVKIACNSLPWQIIHLILPSLTLLYTCSTFLQVCPFRGTLVFRRIVLAFEEYTSEAC